MPTAAYYQTIKAKKRDRWERRAYGWHNYPHSLAEIATSGSLSYTRDETHFTNASTSTTASRYVCSLDFSLANPFTRVFEDQWPWKPSSANPYPLPSGDPGNGEFLMVHRPIFPWRLEAPISDPLPSAVIGDCTREFYTRPTTSDPWALDNTTTTDVTFGFYLLMGAGGDHYTGGRGAGGYDEKVIIQFDDDFGANNPGVFPPILPDFSTTDPDIRRLPWEDPWSSETAIFADIFSNHLVTRNAIDGGGHTGTCSLSLDFH